MREILFRGQDVRGAWHIGLLAHVGNAWYISNKVGVATAYEVIPKTIGQFTGLTDKNGKKIFEGDIVKFTDSPFGYSHIGSVWFHEGSFCIQYTYWNKECFHRIGQTEKWQDMGASGTVTYEYEVLGNIHDNPELLGGSDNA